MLTIVYGDEPKCIYNTNVYNKLIYNCTILIEYSVYLYFIKLFSDDVS